MRDKLVMAENNAAHELPPPVALSEAAAAASASGGLPGPKRPEETQAWLAAIVESSEDAIISQALDGTIRSWNGGAERLFGYPRREALDQPGTLIIPPELHDQDRAIRDKLRHGERIQHFETVRIAQGGTRIEVSMTVSPLRDEQGQVIGTAQVARALTARTHAELAVANAKFRVFFEQGTQFAGVLSVDGKVVEPNRICLDACGYNRDDVIGRPFWECGWWNRSAGLMKMVQSACQQAAAGKLFRTATTYFLADGSERMMDLILAPVNDETGEVLFIAATGSDITDRRQLEDALRAADHKKDQFIAVLAHELRNPLAPIRNGLQVLLLADGSSGAAERALLMMDRQLSHMVRLIDDLLDVSRLNRNKMELVRSRVSLADAVSGAVETARPLIDVGGHELIVSLPQRPIFLDADLTRLAQVFSNLLTNSAKYTEHGGRIWLSAERQGADVVVSVRDSGIGIPVESLASIFDMFAQLDRPLERATGGLGIGLALVKGLVEMHGGTVTAASEGQGRGSTFTVILPTLASQSEPLKATASHSGLHAATPQQRILVVDDNLDGAESLAMMLELLNYDVKTAHDGIEAVEVAEEFRPHVIVMDLGMPRMNGYDATRIIRQRPWGRTITIIALTGWGQDSDRIRSHEAGCDGHLVKPVSLPDLQKLLTEVELS